MNEKDNHSTETRNNKIVKSKSSKAYTQEDAIKEFDELKNIALNCIDKNGNPNISAALRALENKVKIAGLYKNIPSAQITTVKMNEILIDGQQLKLDIGEDVS